MIDRPILFSAPMVQAILAGRKTQTRRIMKTQPKCDVSLNWPRCKTFNPSFDADGSVHCANCGHGMRLTRNGAAGIPCPYGKPGDRLWVRETAIIAPKLWNEGFGANCKDYEGMPRLVQYLATNPNRDAANDYKLKATPSIHMPRWASRITLEITEVRVQRLQEISEEDAKAEGAMAEFEASFADLIAKKPVASTHYLGYKHLWESINGAGSWHANDWVWALTFKAIKETK